MYRYEGNQEINFKQEVVGTVYDIHFPSHSSSLCYSLLGL
jgi:hypothetical protein